MLHPELGEILPLADNQQVVWELHQELSGGEGGSSLYEDYRDRSVMDNYRVFSLLCGRQPVFSGYIDPDCRRGDHPSRLAEDLQTAGLKGPGLSLVLLMSPAFMGPVKERIRTAERCLPGTADIPDLFQF